MCSRGKLMQMSLELINEFYNKVEHQFDLMATHLPHLFIKKGLQGLSQNEMDDLIKDYKAWIANKLMQMDPHDGDSRFGVPRVTFDIYTAPRNGSTYESDDGVEFKDFGSSMGEGLIQMIYEHFNNGDEEYFLRYHKVVCVRKCQNLQRCCDIKKMLEAKAQLEDEMVKLIAQEIRLKKIQLLNKKEDYVANQPEQVPDEDDDGSEPEELPEVKDVGCQTEDYPEEDDFELEPEEDDAQSKSEEVPENADSDQEGAVAMDIPPSNSPKRLRQSSY